MRNKKKNEFLEGYDKIRNSTKHPLVSYKEENRTKGFLLEFNSDMPRQKRSNFGSE